MLTLLVPALLALIVSLALVPACRWLARRVGLVAKPRADRWHGRPTALLGGVAIAVTVLALHLVFVGVRGTPVLLAGAAMMFAIGLADDIRSLKPATKLVFEIGVAAFLVFFGYRLGWVTSLTLDTLLTDMQERGMLDDTLVVWSSEFGRTPKVNANNGGRDHWGPCNSIWMAGAGVPGGYVHGETDKIASEPIAEAVHPADVSATIFWLLGLRPESLIYDPLNRPLPISEGQPIKALV